MRRLLIVLLLCASGCAGGESATRRGRVADGCRRFLVRLIEVNLDPEPDPVEEARRERDEYALPNQVDRTVRGANNPWMR
jgi:hypothetical protein